jgi:hypothetical protein
MAGPRTAAEAIRWAQTAIANAHYLAHEPHFSNQCAKRRVSPSDWRKAIRTARRCKPSDRPPTCGGTSWLLIGTDLEGDELSVAVEAFADHLGRRILLVTAF